MHECKLQKSPQGVRQIYLRKILQIRWEQVVTNYEIAQRMGINKNNDEVRKRIWKWLGHMLRMKRN